MCVTGVAGLCRPAVNLLTSDIIFSYDMTPYLKRTAHDAAAGAISNEIDVAIENCEHPTLIYCPRLTPEHIPVLMPRKLEAEWTAAREGTSKTFHTDVTELFALVVNSGTDRDYNEAATRYRQMFGEEAKNNNAGYFVFKGHDQDGKSSFKTARGWQERYRGPTFNFLDAFDKKLVVPLAEDAYVYNWLKFWAMYTRDEIKGNETLFDVAAEDIYVSHSAKICWSLLLSGRQAELEPNTNPVALEAEPRDENVASAMVWKDECIYKCGPVVEPTTDHTCNNRVHCEKTCLANPLCKGFYLAEKCIDESQSPPCIKGAIAIELPQDRELANPGGKYYAYMALNRFHSDEGLEFNSKGTFPASQHTVPMYTYTQSTANKSALVERHLRAMNCTSTADLTLMSTSRDAYNEILSLCPNSTTPPELPVHNTLSGCKASQAQVCTVDADGMVHELRTGEWIVNPAREYSIVFHNDAASCKSKCMLDDTCMAWTWNDRGCMHHTGIGQITTSSTVADTSVLTELGFDISKRCNDPDHAFDLCMHRCVHIRNKLHQGWCASKWVNCKAGPYAFSGIQDHQRGQSMCAGGSHPEDHSLPGEAIARMSGQAGATTYRNYGGLRMNRTNSERSNRHAVTFENAREGAYTADRCGDIGTYDMTPELFDGWKAWSEAELNTHVEGRMSDITGAVGGSQHSWSTRTFVSMGEGDPDKMNGAAYASPMAGTSSSLADGPTGIRFPKCQVNTDGTGHLYSYTRGNQCDRTPYARMKEYLEKSVREATNEVQAGPNGSPFVGTSLSPASNTRTAGGIRLRNKMHIVCYTRQSAGVYVVSDAHGVPDTSCLPSGSDFTYAPSVYDAEYERAYADSEQCYMIPSQMLTYISEETTTPDYTQLNAHPRGTTCKELESFVPRHLIITADVNKCKEFISSFQECEDALTILRLCPQDTTCPVNGEEEANDDAYIPANSPLGCYLHDNGFLWYNPGPGNSGSCVSAPGYLGDGTAARCVCWSEVQNDDFKTLRYGRYDGRVSNSDARQSNFIGMPYQYSSTFDNAELDQMWFHDSVKSFVTRTDTPQAIACTWFAPLCNIYVNYLPQAAQPQYTQDSTSYFQQCMDSCKHACAKAETNKALCKYCVYAGPDHALQLTSSINTLYGYEKQIKDQSDMYGAPICFITSKCTFQPAATVTSDGKIMADLVRVTEFPFVTTSELPESEELTQLVNKGAMLQESINNMHPNVGHIQNAQRAFADKGDVTQATTYSPAPGDLMLPLTPLKCVLDYNRVFRYPGRISMGYGQMKAHLGGFTDDNALAASNGPLGPHIQVLPHATRDACKSAASSWCTANADSRCQFIVFRPGRAIEPASWVVGSHALISYYLTFHPAEYAHLNQWLQCLVFKYPDNTHINSLTFDSLFTPGVSSEYEEFYQFGCKDLSDELPGAWTDARSLTRNAQRHLDGSEWLAYIATKPTPGSIGHVLPGKAGTGADQNAGNAGFKCPSGVQVGSGRMNGAHWHPLAQTTLMCPHDKPVRCSKLTVVEPVGGTCEYSSETGTQQETWSGALKSEFAKATYSRENWKSKLGNNAPCHIYDFSCHTIEDDIATSVCGFEGNGDTALGGTKCGDPGGSDGYCGVNATDGSRIPPVSATCGDWPTRDRTVCPSGFALVWDENTVALCVPAVRAEKRDGRVRSDTRPTLHTVSLDVGAEYYQSSNCKGSAEVPTNTGKCVPIVCADRSAQDCPAQDLRNGQSSCRSGAAGCETATGGTRQADKSLWWPGFNVVAGSYAGVGPAWYSEMGACDSTARSCHGFSACGPTSDDSASTCVDSITAKCCQTHHGVLKDIDTCAVEPSSKCGGGMYLHNRPEFLATYTVHPATCDPYLYTMESRCCSNT